MPSMKGLGPVSFQGNAVPMPEKAAREEIVSLTVKSKDAESDTDRGIALIHPESCSTWTSALASPLLYLAPARGTDCILTARLDDSAERGCILLDQVQQHNLHLAAFESYDFSLFEPPAEEPFQATELEGEVRLLRGREAGSSGRNEVDATKLRQALSKQLFQRIVAASELVLVHIDGLAIIVRITEVHNLDEEARQEAISYHCYRGLVTPDTIISLVEEGQNHDRKEGAGSLALKADHRRVQLTNNPPRKEADSRATMLDVITADGEEFPVKRKLLRQCISLTHAVRDIEQASVQLESVDTLVFDRVLIYLEAEAAGRAVPDFAVHLLGDLLHAADALGCRSLQDYCRAKLGKLDSAIKPRSFQEVQAHNAAGQCWLCLDGMVLDVTRWLPEHPGGSKIIPAQALDLDCSRFFEVYHSSRESFLYLQEFYIGDLLPQEAVQVPQPEQPSPEFLAQLRAYTTFRVRVDEGSDGKVYKSF
ncbi:g5180 [Coccomyxa viridis]|uniref:G5180 protein n=1 Tax=Coccomyxa viridis TaxID=1274662 RepID=A0ABP1FS68_9CHLO